MASCGGIPAADALPDVKITNAVMMRCRVCGQRWVERRTIPMKIAVIVTSVFLLMAFCETPCTQRLSDMAFCETPCTLGGKDYVVGFKIMNVNKDSLIITREGSDAGKGFSLKYGRTAQLTTTSKFIIDREGGGDPLPVVYQLEYEFFSKR